MHQQEHIYHYKIDTEGRLWIKNNEQTDPQVLKFFMKKIEKLADGRFRVLCMGETNWIEAEDVPYVVQTLEIKEKVIELVFPGYYKEQLDPATLFVGKSNVLYCKVRNGAFTARFQRKVYMELSHWIEGDEKNAYFFCWQGHRYKIGKILI